VPPHWPATSRTSRASWARSPPEAPAPAPLGSSTASPCSASAYIVSGLRSLGADPSTIKYVVVTHGLGDHFGGTQVMMAPADWDLVASTNPADAPARDLDITDGQKLTLGGTTVTLHHTPGHTPGTVSPIFPARWRGRSHTAMLWGPNPPSATTSKETYLPSALTFASWMRGPASTSNSATTASPTTASSAWSSCAARRTVARTRSSWAPRQHSAS